MPEDEEIWHVHEDKSEEKPKEWPEEEDEDESENEPGAKPRASRSEGSLTLADATRIADSELRNRIKDLISKRGKTDEIIQAVREFDLWGNPQDQLKKTVRARFARVSFETLPIVEVWAKGGEGVTTKTQQWALERSHAIGIGQEQHVVIENTESIRLLVQIAAGWMSSMATSIDQHASVRNTESAYDLSSRVRAIIPQAMDTARRGFFQEAASAFKGMG